MFGRRHHIIVVLFKFQGVTRSGVPTRFATSQFNLLRKIAIHVLFRMCILLKLLEVNKHVYQHQHHIPHSFQSANSVHNQSNQFGTPTATATWFSRQW